MRDGHRVTHLTMTPKMPSALPKISTIRILTKSVESCASARAHAAPATPTQILEGDKMRAERGMVRVASLARRAEDNPPLFAHAPAAEVRKSNPEPGPKNGVTRVSRRNVVPLPPCHRLRQRRRIGQHDLVRQNDAQNHAVDGRRLAKDNAAAKGRDPAWWWWCTRACMRREGGGGGESESESESRNEATSLPPPFLSE